MAVMKIDGSEMVIIMLTLRKTMMIILITTNYDNDRVILIIMIMTMLVITEVPELQDVEGPKSIAPPLLVKPLD